MTRPAVRWGWAIGIAALLAAIHTIVWQWTAARIEAGLPVFVAQAEAAGWHLRGGVPTRAGWPLAVTLRIPAVEATLDGTALRWTTERLDVTLAAADPQALHLTPVGAQNLMAPDPVRYTAGSTTLRIPLDPDRPTTFAIADLVVTDVARASRLTGRIDALGLLLEGNASPMPPGPLPFDGDASFAVAFTLSSPIVPAATAARAARDWHDRGGRMDMPQLKLDWGPLHLTGSGALHLDGDLRPAGRATVQAKGLEAAFDAVAGAAGVAPGPAAAVRAVIGLLARSTPDGTVPLPISLADGIVTVAQFPLARIPPIWP